MAPLEPWEKVLVSTEFANTIHGSLPCTECHQGDAAASSKDAAHTNLIARPSEQPWQSCGYCHTDITDHAEDSLHSNLAGYWTVLDERSLPEDHQALMPMFENHCSSCHTTCGDCHISQPKSVGGGFIEGHLVNAQPSMTRNCTACHGSRVGNEYLGKNEGFKPDVHFRQARMVCTDCHSGAEMHGDLGSADTPEHRYDGAQMPRCETCHPTAVDGSDGIEMHGVHDDKLSCQVCHSIAYSSCDGCHVAISENTGNPFFETEGRYMTFFLGLNPEQSAERPYTYVPLRHVPISTSSFEFYGSDLLKNFDNRPTWVYATPHNIQRETPQNESCAACHSNPEIFLTADKVKPEELNANQPVIVKEIPKIAP